MPRRLALFLPELRAGGAQRVMLTLAKAFIGYGANVDLVLARKEGAFLTDIPDGVNLIDLRAKSLGLGRAGIALSVLPGLIRYFKNRRPDVFVSTLTGTNLVAVLGHSIARSSSRLILREAATLMNLRNQAYVWLMRRFYSRADAVISLTPFMRTELIKSLNLEASKVVSITNPVDAAWVLERAAVPAPHPWLNRNMPPVFIAVGRLTEQKDLPTLIQAFALVRTRMDARLIILGEGPLRERLEQLVNNMGIEDRVIMPGYDANPYRWMARARAFVLTSRWEGQPNALLEAMCLQLPVAATAYDTSIHALVGECGKVVPVGDYKAMADAMESAASMSTAGKQPVGSIQENSLQAYQELLFPGGGLG